jgi:cytochrome P450
MTGARLRGGAGTSRPVAVPGPRGRELLRSLPANWRDRLGMMSYFTEKFGDAIRFKMGPTTLYFFNHPDHAKHVLADNAGNYQKGLAYIQSKRVLGDGLLTSEGDLWRRQRRVIQPVFRRERIAGFTGAIVEEAAGFLSRLDAQVGRGPLNVTAAMTDLALGVLGRTLLQADLTPFDMIGPAFAVAEDQAIFEALTMGLVPVWLPIPRNRRFRAARRAMEDVVSDLVAQRRENGGDGQDMISRLLEAADADPGPAGRNLLRDELVTILLAGHETTASTLSWTWYLVGSDAGVWERLHAEAVEVLGDREPVYDDLPALRYTLMVIQEAMRLYPPVWILPRRSVGPDEIGGYHVPAGADVMICPYTLHRHSGFWTEPARFDPGRFDPAVAEQRHRYAYIPFGAGPRFCVGNSLGMLEATLVVAMVARAFRLRTIPGHKVTADPMMSLRVHGGLPMTVHRA